MYDFIANLPLIEGIFLLATPYNEKNASSKPN